MSEVGSNHFLDQLEKLPGEEAVFGFLLFKI